MSNVIACIFVGDNSYRDYVYRRVMNERSFGATPGDSLWMGYQDYDEVDPFASCRDEEESKPITVPAWRARIDKAKREIEKHRERIEWQKLEDDSAGVFAADDVARLVELVRGAFDV